MHVDLKKALKQIGKLIICIGIVVALIGLYLLGSAGGFEATQQTIGKAVSLTHWGLLIVVIGIILLFLGQ